MIRFHSLSGPLEVEMKPYLLMSCGLPALMLSGCMMDPMVPSPLYSRLPAPENQVAQPLSPQEQQRYNQIDRQVLADQQQSIAADAAAQVYRTPIPVSFYGGYSSGGWGNRWNTGVGVGYGYGPHW